MTEINGPVVKKTIVVPEHTVEVLDEDAYWHLDWLGNEDEDGTLLYAKVAWPTLQDAQRQHKLQRAALDAERANRPKRAYRKRSKQ